MQIKHWLLIGIILSVPAVKADNSTFIDEHFAQDSALVLFSGAVVSAALEVICHIAVPDNQGRAACQYFAPEATTFLYLAKNQWPTGVVEVWSSMNIALFAVAMVYIRHAYESPVSKVRMIVIYMIYPQIAQIMANTAFHYLTGSDPTHLPAYIPTNSMSAGLIAGGVVLWFMYKQTSEYRPFYLLTTSAGTTLILILLYFYLEDSNETSFSEKAGIAAVVVAGPGIIAGPGLRIGAEIEAAFRAIARLVIGVEIEAGGGVAADAVTIVLAGGGVAAAAAAVAGVAAETAARVVAGTVAGAGAFIIMLTGSMTSTLRQWTTAFSIANHLIMTAAVGLPLMVSSWIISWSRFVETNATAHDTMQGGFIIPLNKLRAFYPERQ